MILKLAGHTYEGDKDVLAGDIGATKTNLAFCHWNGTGLSVQKTVTYKTKSFQDIGSMIREFIANEKMPGKICLGIAGPVQDGKVSLTNVHWEIEGKALSEEFNQVPVSLINDLEATAYGLAVIEQKNVHELYEGGKEAKGNMAIIAPGTGLGEAGLYQGLDGYYPFGTEGGHCDFAPRTDLDIEFYHFLKRKFGHVSWERVISGPGICTIYDFLRLEKDRSEPAWLKEKILMHDKASVISENAGECEICGETMELFIRYLAEESANLVLKLKASGGLFIAGGIIPHILPILHKEVFMKWFTSAGRLKSFLQSVPIKIVLNDKTPLLGAAWYGLLVQPS
jgi:glucokinase